MRKLDANTYTTALTGLKYKLAHKRAGKDTWSASDQAQRRHLIKILQEMIDDLTADMLKDPEFLAEAKKRQWEIAPVSGERLEVLAKEVINQPPDIIERMKKVMGES